MAVRATQRGSDTPMTDCGVPRAQNNTDERSWIETPKTVNQNNVFLLLMYLPHVFYCSKGKQKGGAWCCMPTVPASKRLRQKHCKLVSCNTVWSTYQASISKNMHIFPLPKRGGAGSHPPQIPHSLSNLMVIQGDALIFDFRFHIVCSSYNTY